jgi:hypothetical protein
MKHAIMTGVLLCSHLVAAPPAQESGKTRPVPAPDKGQVKNHPAKADPQDELRQQLDLLAREQRLVAQDDRSVEEIRRTRTGWPVRVSGTLVKTPDKESVDPRTRVPQRYLWHLAARLDSGRLIQPLQIADKKLLKFADECAGKEVVLTGSTGIATRLGRRYESAAEPVPYLVVEVESLKLAEK